jgi:hypothetical protein
MPSPTRRIKRRDRTTGLGPFPWERSELISWDCLVAAHVNGGAQRITERAIYEVTQGVGPNFPMIADVDYNVSKLYGMLPAPVSGDPTKRTAADNQTVRNVFAIGPDKKVKLILIYPMTTGRNFDEVLRVIDSLQLTAKHKVATPVNWRNGEDVIIAGSVSDDDARKTYPQGWNAPKPYIRIVPQPR